VPDDWTEDFRSLLGAPSPAVLTIYRKDGSANVSPVWFRWHDDTFEVVVADGDVKLKHLERDPRCILVVFETVPPFRGLEVRGYQNSSMPMSRQHEKPSAVDTSEANTANASPPLAPRRAASCCAFPWCSHVCGISPRSFRHRGECRAVPLRLTTQALRGRGAADYRRSGGVTFGRRDDAELLEKAKLVLV